MVDEHPLYTAAMAADAAFVEAIRFVTGGKRDRWTMTDEYFKAGAIQAAYRNKVTADEAWLNAMRQADVASGSGR